ncbi:MAG: M15 family metallopeptidase [Rubrivivax sp.]|nr:M15 family metallopeptidase [Rubrivivax sp.]
MPKPYILKKGDTLAKIAAAQLGDAKLASLLVSYNGLAGARDIVVGQAIHLPPRADIAAAKAPRRKGQAKARSGGPIRPWPAAPNGLAAILEMFGDPAPFVLPDGTVSPKWEIQQIARAKLPFPIPYTGNPAVMITKIACHKKLVPLFEAVFADIQAQGLQGSVKTYGGGYVARMKRGQSKPSTHTWGIAIDLNDRTNAMGTAGDIDPKLVALFESYGFVWGGRWGGANKDPMHFQYCSGY